MHRFIVCIFILSLLVIAVTQQENAMSPSHYRSNQASDMPLPLQMAFSEAIGQDDSAYHIDAATHTATNPDHAYDVQFGDNGVMIMKNGDTWGLELASYGYDDHLMSVDAPTIEQSANRVSYHRDMLDEWYINGQMGLQQGFTLHEPPAVSGDGELTLVMNQSGTMQTDLRGDTLHLTGENGTNLTYGGLYAFDADGQTLPSQFELGENELAIVVDDSAATYPLTIDPWVQQAKLLPVDGIDQDYFGYSVALDGETAIAGAIRDDDFGYSSGSAYVFTRSGTTWTQQAKLLPVDGAEDDSFGWSVDVDGDTVLVGVPGDDDFGYSSGSAYVFTRSGTTWTQQAKLIAPDAEISDAFGYAVSIDGDTVLVSAIGYDDTASNIGAVYVFTRSGTAWAHQATLLPGDGANADKFGQAVALIGDTALIGSQFDDDNGANSGSAYIFTRSGAIWGQQAKLLATDGQPEDQFGVSVALDNDTAIIGAFHDDDKGTDSGSAYIFTRSGAIWSQQAKLLAADGTVDDIFGYAVSLSGNIAVIGSYLDDDNGGWSGSAYAFTRLNTNWYQLGKIVPFDGASGDRFGSAVAISGATVLGGAWADDDNGGNSGSVYVFVLDTTILSTSATCNDKDLEVAITTGEGPFDITSSTGTAPGVPVNSVLLGVTVINGPGKWKDLTITETTGGGESVNLGVFRCYPPDRPVPQLPAHLSHTTNPYPTFSWTGIGDGTNYRLRVWIGDKNAPDFEIRENSGGLTTHVLSIPLDPGGYQWRVRGRANNIWSRWSVRFIFFIDPATFNMNSPITPIPTIELEAPNQRATQIPTIAPPPSTLPAPPNSR